MFSEIFNSLNANAPTIFLFDVIINVFLAFIFGLLIATLYRTTYKGYSYSTVFINTLIIITMVTAVVIMVIGNNLARAFGLVGAMSIIRFRTALKDSRDIAFIFFALAAGMAAGAGNHLIGLIAVPLIGGFIFILFLTNYGSRHKKELILRFWMTPEDRAEPIYLSVFSKYLSDYTMINVRSARLGQFLELSFYVRLKKIESSQDFIRELSALEGIERASLVMTEETESV
jgi:hypothetical protein